MENHSDVKKPLARFFPKTADRNLKSVNNRRMNFYIRITSVTPAASLEQSYVDRSDVSRFKSVSCKNIRIARDNSGYPPTNLISNAFPIYDVSANWVERNILFHSFHSVVLEI